MIMQEKKIHFSFTPSLMDAESLEALFVQREDLAARIVDLTRDSALTAAKYHFLLVGPRGIGKTHAVSLIYHRVKALPDIREKLLIAWLREDIWGVSSFLDLLIQILQAICKEDGDEALRVRTEEIFQHAPKQAERVAADLLNEYVGTRTLLLIVENLDALFTGLGDAGQKRLRAYLQENPFCTILATSPSLFNGVSLQTSPFYGFFTTHHLQEFDFDHAHDFLTRIAAYRKDTKLTSFLRTPQGRARVRAVHHLAGGNPRVYTIFAQFLNRASLERLVGPFMRAMDDLTPYYQSRMTLLSAQQRKIIELLCERRGAITVKEIAQRCFITHQTASGQLKQLREMRYVSATPIGRESYYELSEPLMRICLDVKKHRGEPLRLFVEFLRCWYTKPELERLLEAIPVDAQLESQYIKQALMMSKEGASTDPRISSCRKDLERHKEAGQYDKALKVVDELEAAEGETPQNLIARGRLLFKLKRYQEALQAYSQVVTLDATQQDGWCGVGINFLYLKQHEDALNAFDRAIELGEDSPEIWGLRGTCQQKLDRREDAMQSFKRLIELDPKDAGGWDCLGCSFFSLQRFEEAVEAFAELHKLGKRNERSLLLQHLSLFGADKIQNTIDFGNEHEAILSKHIPYLGTQALALSLLGRDVEALSYWQRAIDLGDSSAFVYLGKTGSLIALKLWGDVDTSLKKALDDCMEIKSLKQLHTAQLVEKIFTTKSTADFWQQGVRLLVSRFAEHKALSALAAGLIRTIPMIMQKTVSDATAVLWRETWAQAASGSPEMELALRLLDTSVRYKAENDPRLLMELPVEERKILEEVIGSGDDPVR